MKKKEKQDQKTTIFPISKFYRMAAESPAVIKPQSTSFPAQTGKDFFLFVLTEVDMSEGS